MKTTKEEKMIKISKKDIEGNFDIDYLRALLWVLVGKYGLKEGVKKWMKNSK